MKAVRYHGARDIRVEDIAEPHPGHKFAGLAEGRTAADRAGIEDTPDAAIAATTSGPPSRSSFAPRSAP